MYIMYGDAEFINNHTNYIVKISRINKYNHITVMIRGY